MEYKKSRLDRKKQEAEKKQQECNNGGLTTLRALADFSRVVELIKKAMNYIKTIFE